MCPDHTGELADLSLGDAWLPELKGQKLGESLILTRTEAGERLLSLERSAGALFVRVVESEGLSSLRLSHSNSRK